MNKHQSLRILYITNDKNIVAIAPLRQSNYSIKSSFNYSVIEPLDYGSATDYTGLILAEQEIECLRIFISYLFSQKDWDYIYLNDIPEQSLIVDLLVKNNSLFPNFEIEEGAKCPYIPIPDSIENFLKGYSRNFRKNLKRSLRKLQRDYGKVELKDYRDLGSLEDMMNLFFNLHQKRWVSKKGPGAFKTQRVRDLFLDRAKLFAEKGWFGLFFLIVDEKPVAAKYVLEHNKKMYGCLSGFDPAYSSYSLGSLLLLKVIENCVEREFKEYDFMKGDELYKFKWAKNYRKNSNIKFINNRFRSQLITRSLEVKRRMQIDTLSRKLIGLRKIITRK